MQDLGEVRARLARERGAIHDAEGGTTLAVHFVTAHGAGVAQAVSVWPVTVRDGSWLLVRAEVCATSWFESGRAVRHGATLAVGSLCAFNGAYVMQHTVPLSATYADLDATIYLVAHEAARLRELVVDLTPSRASCDAFAAYAE